MRLPHLCLAAEFRAAWGAWNYDLSGSVTQDGRNYDLQDDLALQRSGRRSLQVEWDTPAGWPDLSARFSRLGARGHAEYQTIAFDILGNPIGTDDQTIDAAADFDDYDLTARWPLRLGALQLALGVTVKRLSGTVEIDDSGNPPASREQYAETVPELHAALRLPLAGWLALAGSAQGIAQGGNSALEWHAAAELRLKALLLEAGWQEKRYELDLDGRALDARLAGALARVGLAF
jgi:hypothetical protein